MRLTVLPYDVTYKGRATTLDGVARAVAEHVAGQPGNHLVFCPSMQYLSELESKLAELIDRPVFAQTSLMDESQRRARGLTMPIAFRACSGCSRRWAA